MHYSADQEMKSINRFLENTKRLVVTKLKIQENVDELIKFVEETEAKLRLRQEELKNKIDEYNKKK